MDICRRDFFKVLAGGLACLSKGVPVSYTCGYRVGIGRRLDPYAATRWAVHACGEWPSGLLAGKTVIIKPNLVMWAPADTGTTTDPEVVRALVDLALRDGAQKVLIVEGGPYGAPFSACGYGFFENYDPFNRVHLVDLNAERDSLVDVPYGLAYAHLWMPEIISQSEVFFISAAKMKTHVLGSATLSLKNLFGLPLNYRYKATYATGRFAMHERGVHQVVSDLSSVCPIDFAVVDGIWAMEGNGPIQGDPVRMNTVVAGTNPVAVDRVCLKAMGIHQWGVQHLNIASRMGKGPSNLAEIQVVGDPLVPRSFLLPELPPVLECPWVFPRFFSPREGQASNILFWLGSHTASVQVRIVKRSPQSTELTHVRTILDWTVKAPGLHFASWDGRDDNGDLVPGPAYYPIQIHAKRCDVSGLELYAMGWVYVNS